MIPYRYEIIAQDSDEHARLLIYGAWQQPDIVWQAEVFTLQAYYRHQHPGQPLNKNIKIRQFIDVDDRIAELPTLHIGLNVQKIDKPTILKTVVMINQYRRLCPGKHEYGPEITIGT